MSIYQHVLFATDLSESNKALAERVSSLAGEMGAKVTLVHTIEPIPAYGYPGYADLESPFIEEAKKALAELGKTMHIAENAQRVEFGSVKSQVISVAEELGVDLIIIGSHGRHGLARLLGSSANSIIQQAKCDVLTLRCKE